MRRDDWWNIEYAYYDTGDNSMLIKYDTFTVAPVTTAGGRIVSLTRDKAEALAIHEANKRHRPFYRLVKMAHVKTVEWGEVEYG